MRDARVIDLIGGLAVNPLLASADQADHAHAASESVLAAYAGYPIARWLQHLQDV